MTAQPRDRLRGPAAGAGGGAAMKESAPASGSVGRPTQVPSIYSTGYEQARAMDPALAATYIAHMRIGDPAADAVMADLAGMKQAESSRLLQAAMDQQEDVLRHAPESLQRFVNEVAALPAWYDRQAAFRGCRVFLRNSDQFLMGFAGAAIVEGFSTTISRSFAITGRLIDDGVRRLKQNLRQLLDMFLPRGIEPSGDGWKLTLRIRMVHARARSLIRYSSEWDHDAWGLPINAAHVSLGAAAFSARLLQFATMLGAPLDDEDRAGFMAVWSYAAYLMGVPEALMFHSQAEGLRLFRVATACEPPPDYDAVTMAHCILNSAPIVIGVTEPRARHAFAQYAFRVSRELVGNALADQLRFPPSRSFLLLPWLRTRTRIARMLKRFLPRVGKASERKSFAHLLALADLGERRFTYDLPDRVRSDESTKW